MKLVVSFCLESGSYHDCIIVLYVTFPNCLIRDKAHLGNVTYKTIIQSWCHSSGKCSKHSYSQPSYDAESISQVANDMWNGCCLHKMKILKTRVGSQLLITVSLYVI